MIKDSRVLSQLKCANKVCKLNQWFIHRFNPSLITYLYYRYNYSYWIYTSKIDLSVLKIIVWIFMAFLSSTIYSECCFVYYTFTWNLYLWVKFHYKERRSSTVNCVQKFGCTHCATILDKTAKLFSLIMSKEVYRTF